MQYKIGDIIKIINPKSAFFEFERGAVKRGHLALILGVNSLNRAYVDIGIEAGHRSGSLYKILKTRRGQVIPNEYDEREKLTKETELVPSTFLYMYNNSLFFLNNETNQIITFNNVIKEYYPSALKKIVKCIINNTNNSVGGRFENPQGGNDDK